MGNACDLQASSGVKSRLVRYLGHRTMEEGDGDHPEAAKHVEMDMSPRKSGTFRHRVLCPRGHIMKAKVVKEMLVTCYAERECDHCDTVCDDQVSRYICKVCDVVYCNTCARAELGLPELEERGAPLQVQTGDILLAGPDAYGIHHVILVRSGWKPVDPEVSEVLHLEPGADVLACETIESTQGSVGTQTWYPSTSFFVRDPKTGGLSLVADLPPNSDELQQAINPVATKMLLHPFRPANGGPCMDEAAFLEVVGSAAASSVKYGKRTAMKSVVNSFFHRERLDARDFPTEESRGKLAGMLKSSWSQRPICASVAVMCWQQYFFKVGGATDEAVQQILEYMPHWCHKTTPAALVKSLTLHGWVISDTADGGEE